jgi:hypothetical protein
MPPCDNCGDDVSKRLSLLGVTLSSGPRCRGCRIYYCDRCHDRLRDKKVRWWVPTLSSPGKVCPECGADVPPSLRWYHYLFGGPGL